MAEAMTVHAYPMSSLRADYLRAGIGLALCLLTLLPGKPHVAVTAILVVVAALFAAHGLNTVVRHVSRLTMGEDAIAATGWRQVRLAWNEIAFLRLAYYSTARARDRRKGDNRGWMQLRLKGPGGTINLDSSLDGFDRVVRGAIAAARANGVPLDGATLDNLKALETGAPGEGSGP